MNQRLIRDYISKYKKQFNVISSKELYKWKAVKAFQDNWDISAPDFQKMLKAALSETKNLMDSGQYFPRGILFDLTAKAPESLRLPFQQLYDEEQDILGRIKTFQESIEELRAKHLPNAKRNYQDLRAVVVYLVLRFPERYYFYKYEMFLDLCRIIGYAYQPKKGSLANLGHFLSLSDLILHEISQDQDLLKLHKRRLDDSCYIDEHLHLLTQDFIYAITKYLDVENSAVEPAKVTRRQKSYGRPIPNPDLEPTFLLKPRILNFQQNEAENKRIGNLGELWVVAQENSALRTSEHPHLSNKIVEHVSKTQGDGAGFDIQSWDSKGNKIFIEVKTTRGKLETPFYITRSELERSKRDSDKYRLYRVFNYDEAQNTADLVIFEGDLSTLCSNPMVFRTSLRLQK